MTGTISQLLTNAISGVAQIPRDIGRYELEIMKQQVSAFAFPVFKMHKPLILLYAIS